ncbi:MAG TPA: carboxypeptidase-like regulatory domain-containing protein, partial [Acidobacteriota bacterium]|nr:carboxypeptidase-like regulatory domain-containing protein [Acidobacteriota bacterium]
MPVGPLNDHTPSRQRLFAVKSVAAFLALNVLAIAAEAPASAAPASQPSASSVVAPANSAIVRGLILLPDGEPAVGVLVSIRETGQSTETDADGEFEFSNVSAPSLYTVVAATDGYRPLHQTGVYTKSGETVTLAGQRLRRAAGTDLKPEIVAAELPTKLDRYEVSESKLTPYMAANLDIKRTVDDVQPYTVFDSKTIEMSGARNIEEFFRQRLTMNTITQLSSEINDGAAMARES